MAAGATPGAWVLVLSLWGEPLPHLWKALGPLPGLPWALTLLQLPCPPCASLTSPPPSSFSTLLLSPRDSGRLSKRHGPDREAAGAQL